MLTRLPQVSIADATVIEGNGAASAVMTLTLDRRSKEPVRISVQSVAGGAAGLITPAAQEVVIAAGATATTVAVPFVGNTTKATAPQSYQVVASVPTSSVVDDAFARLVISDDD